MSFNYDLRLAVLYVLVLVGCTNETQTRSEQAVLSADSLSGIPQPDSSGFEAEEAFVDNGDTARLLNLGTYHGEEVWEGAEKENWWGLFKGTSGFYLAETKLKTKRVLDEIVDASNEKTGWKVSPLNKDSCIVLITGLNFLTNHPVHTVALSKRVVLPGDTLRLNIMGAQYKLFATGKKDSASKQHYYGVSDYKLYLSAKKAGRVITDLLVEQKNFDDQMISIIFAGDIDNDNFPDLLINTSWHYNVFRPTLYLSKPAGSNHLLKRMGSHMSVGC